MTSRRTGIKTFTLPAGPVQLDGATAKKFATYRYVQTDFGRTQRQQQLIWAIRNRVLEANLLPKIPVLWSALSDTFTTDLDLPAVLKLARLASRLQARDVHGMQFGEDTIEVVHDARGLEVLRAQGQGPAPGEAGRDLLEQDIVPNGQRRNLDRRVPSVTV